MEKSAVKYLQDVFKWISKGKEVFHVLIDRVKEQFNICNRLWRLTLMNKGAFKGSVIAGSCKNNKIDVHYIGQSFWTKNRFTHRIYDEAPWIGELERLFCWAKSDILWQ